MQSQTSLYHHYSLCGCVNEWLAGYLVVLSFIILCYIQKLLFFLHVSMSLHSPCSLLVPPLPLLSPFGHRGHVLPKIKTRMLDLSLALFSASSTCKDYFTITFFSYSRIGCVVSKIKAGFRTRLLVLLSLQSLSCRRDSQMQFRLKVVCLMGSCEGEAERKGRLVTRLPPFLLALVI